MTRTDKIIKSEIHAKDKKPKAELSYLENDGYPNWRFSLFDHDGPFNFKSCRNDDIIIIMKKLAEFEKMKWQKIKEQTHDKSGSSHYIKPNSFNAKALKRWKELCSNNQKYEEFEDHIFSIRLLSNMNRIIGILTGSIFYIIWYDPNHAVAKINAK
jgi:hypothetical protein